MFEDKANMSWRLQLEDGLAADFETNLSGLGTELGTGAYNMRFVCIGSYRLMIV